MKHVSTGKQIGIVAGVVLLAACAQTKNMPQKGGITSYVIESEKCGKIELPDGSTGLLRVDFFNNHLSNEPDKLAPIGKAVMFKKAPPAGKGYLAYTVLGYLPRSKADVAEIGKLEIDVVGANIGIKLGTETPPPEASSLKAMTASAMRAAVSAKEDNAPDTVDISLQCIIPGLPEGVCLTSQSVPALAAGARASFVGQEAGAASAGEAPKPKPASRYRSLAIDLKRAGAAAATIPGRPDPLGKPVDNSANFPKGEIKKDGGLKLTVAGDTNPPTAGVSSSLLVQLTDLSPNPSYQAVCNHPDVPASADGAAVDITIPTVWGAEKTGIHELPKGKVQIAVIRTYRSIVDNVVVEIGRGAIFAGELAKPPAAAAK